MLEKSAAGDKFIDGSRNFHWLGTHVAGSSLGDFLFELTVRGEATETQNLKYSTFGDFDRITLVHDESVGLWGDGAVRRKWRSGCR